MIINANDNIGGNGRMSRERQYDIPKKILHIRDLTFILPDDFEGTINDALAVFIEYRKKVTETDVKFVDDFGLFSTAELLIHGSNRTEMRVCGEYGLFELRDGTYVLIDGSVPTITRATDSSMKGRADEPS